MRAIACSIFLSSFRSRSRVRSSSACSSSMVARSAGSGTTTVSSRRCSVVSPALASMSAFRRDSLRRKNASCTSFMYSSSGMACTSGSVSCSTGRFFQLLTRLGSFWMEDGTGGVITRSFMVEKVALTASGAWVGTTAACVICSIITFLAARLPRGRGVDSTTTGAGAGGGRLATGADATLATARVGLLGGTVAAEVATALVSDRTFAVGATLVGVFAATAVLAAALPRASTALGAALLTVLAAVAFLTGAAFLATGLLTTKGARPDFAAVLVGVFVTALAGAFGTGFDGTAGFFWVDTGDTCPLAALVAVGVVFAVLVAGAFTRCLLSVPVNAWSWGCALPPTGVRGASSHAGCAGCFVVIPRLRSASGLRTARRLEADLAGRWAPDLGRDCNDDGVVGTDMAPDRKPRRWRSETNSTFRSDSGAGNGRSPAHTSDWSSP